MYICKYIKNMFYECLEIFKYEDNFQDDIYMESFIEIMNDM
jgi:hypothetical protein